MRFNLRTGEKAQQVASRAERFYKLHHFWFFTTREGASIGPFDSKACAEVGVAEYISFVKSAPQDVLELISAAA
jgi:hypothetical protein